jgi:hypothetical protein
MNFCSFVIAGLDPAIHEKAPHVLRVIMDARVEPAHDEMEDVNRIQKKLNRNQTFRLTPHPAEKSHFSTFARYLTGTSARRPLNQKVKP